ncbi:hypothetical protein GYMLUDRAFT_201987 [Collybiopsis luxurians FD-317 M1]|uniref:4-coumarate--CoA ligase n=1 Tax=Collybiopsis luxurians FD-317 M1 TaxID=944289 RepID=A0A0D0CLG4_9AGAR|nr:hypothetical protein GYMLUDRAFT_201987 [Collybiopsis luxurians FD-317 M1]
MRSRTAALAAALHSHYGIGDSDVVMICSPNHVDYPIIVWAVHSLGGIVTLSNPRFTKYEIAQQVRLTRANLFILHTSVIDTLSPELTQLGMSTSRIISFGGHNQYCSVEDLVGRAEHRKNTIKPFVKLGGDRIALLALSSGTTGTPKAVQLTHRGIIINILQMAAHIARSGNEGFAPGDLILHTLPFFHVAGFVLGLHLCLFLHMSVIITEQYDFLRMLEDVVRFDVTTLLLVPPQAITLCKHPATKYFPLDSVKMILMGAAPVPEELSRSVAATVPGARVGQVYGLTEVSCTLAMTVRKHSLPGSAGQLLPGIEARVVKLDGTLANSGERGELYIKTPSAALGYLDNVKGTDETFCNNWIRTGDEVLLTPDNELFVFDRVKDVIKVKGFQVAPAELEGHLLGHPVVLDVAIIGIPHQYSGQVPFAFVVLRETAKRRTHEDGDEDHQAAAELKSSILNHVSQRTASYKKISGIKFVDSIPKTPSGKVLRRALRATWEKERQKAKL